MDFREFYKRRPVFFEITCFEKYLYFFYTDFIFIKIIFVQVKLNSKNSFILTNKNAQKLIDKIISDLDQNGIVTNTLIEDLKELRPYSVKEKRPVVAKAIRQIYEHVEEFNTFAIPIPKDEEIIDEEGEVINTNMENTSPTESLLYLMSLIRNEEHRQNKQEIRQYNDALKAYAEDYA